VRARLHVALMHCTNDHPVVKAIDSVSSTDKQRTRAIALTALIIVCFIAWIGLAVPKGIPTNTDELLTAERSREMLLTTPWVVHLNFQRSFAKPP